MLKNSDVSPRWMRYVLVDDIKIATDKARPGRQVVKHISQVGDYGWMSIIVDPTGAMLALWKLN